MNHYNIPIFINHIGCPHTCVFCNQIKINGKETDTKIEDIKNIVDEYLLFLPQKSTKEVAFFGGTFTGIDLNIQKEYLKVVRPYIKRGIIDGVRLSTRPDSINKTVLDLLLKYGVTTIELGVQSLDNTVLLKSERGYNVATVHSAVNLIKEYGFKLGIQIMPGLPGSNHSIDFETAKEVIKLNPDMVRIYPTLVIQNTSLEKMYYLDEYTPLTLDEAVDRVLPIMILFELNNINIIRIGLQPSDDLQIEGVVKAGPFHPAFKENIETEIYGRFFHLLKLNRIDIVTHEKNVSKIIGLNKKNRLIYKESMKIKIDNSLPIKKIIINSRKYSRKQILKIVFDTINI